MIKILRTSDSPKSSLLLDSMYYDRRRVFVDWMGWDVSVVDGREVDCYDDSEAVYLIIPDPLTGKHRASVRVLRTDRAHILSDHFAYLCVDGVPRGESIREITRLCISPDCPPCERTIARQALVSGLVSYALATGVTAYTAVTQINFLSRVLAAGWRCRPLGLPVGVGAEAIGALIIEIDQYTADEIRILQSTMLGRKLGICEIAA